MNTLSTTFSTNQSLPQQYNRYSQQGISWDSATFNQLKGNINILVCDIYQICQKQQWFLSIDLTITAVFLLSGADPQG